MKVRDALAALALDNTPDPLWAVAALLTAANVVLGKTIGDDEAREAIIGTYLRAAQKARH